MYDAVIKQLGVYRDSKIIMPYCAVLECKNDSRTKNKSHGGVSYHKFPNDAFIKEIWINATGRKDWMPTKTSRICSEHFNETDFEISAKGFRYITDSAVPTQKILTFHVHINDYVRPDKLKKPILELPTSTRDASTRRVLKEEYKNKFDDMSLSSITDNIKSGGTLRWAQNKIKKQGLKIKRLQAQNRRLKKKLMDTFDLLKKIEDKFSLSIEEHSSGDLKTNDSAVICNFQMVNNLLNGIEGSQ